MFGIILKNNLKLIFRNKMILIIGILAPIVVIAAVSNAFGALLGGDYESSQIELGYTVVQEGNLAQFIENAKDELEEEKIVLRQIDADAAKELVKNGELDAAFVEKDGEVTILTLNDESVETMMCHYIIDQMYSTYQDEYVKSASANYPIEYKAAADLEAIRLQGTKYPNAETYYGIVEAVYFAWIGMLFLAAVVQSEKKNRISQRYLSAPVSGLTLYLTKLIPCTLVTIMSTCASVFVSTLCFDIRWGNIAGTIAVMLLTVLAGSAVGVVLLYLFKSYAAAVVFLFSAIWMFGFMGGSFDTYMFSYFPDSVKKFSPIYHVNKTLVEFSTNGTSEQAGICVAVLSGIIVASFILGGFIMKRRMEEE